MDRLCLWILPAALFWLQHARATGAFTCRCFPGEPCWPSARQWSDFNATLNGRLIATVPISSVCHTRGEFAAYDERACADLISNWQRPITHYATSSSPMAAWFANFSCSPFLSAETPCTADALQRYAVNVSGVEDVQKTLQFAREHNIRLVIRNTGHDYLGKSTAPGALALWTHHLKEIRHLHYTSPSYNGSAMRLGAGVQGFEGMMAAYTQGKVIVTGNCESVGVVGGYTQGGGHGQLASQFGLAADQVLEWEVVTAAGELLIASSTDNSDLFWALSGGGGGTFGVVLGVTVKTHPEMATASATLSFGGPGAVPSIFWDIVRTFVVSITPLIDAGAVGIWEIMGSSFRLTPIALPGGTVQQLQDALAPTLVLLQQYNLTHEYHINNFSTFWESYGAMNPPSNITEAQLGGRLIPRKTLESNPDGLISALKSIAALGVVISGVSLNVSRAALPYNAVNPAWREAAISVVLGT
ncbi:FAD-linked oxidoreductase sor8 [Penicillium macrosclerotiorum]|uniref:FAD-linked oxidoreductase sor8 n=1 Tax=Penicillium macrosclerotiorum TaxID=303699 RepID=UPI00254907D0|nr:FAD-linked oxidoreductase sor8 [Penicillium macrosclerotiorum]KAJ5669803.1 FAD-linked oxidoreductase sor8 [Penicillium macrosclerotiorum]